MGKQNVIVTGGNRGIGYALVRGFLKEGCNVWVCVRTQSTGWEKELYEMADAYGVWIKTVCLDLEDKESIVQAAKTILSDQIRIDCLVNNAGISGTGLFLMTSMQEIEKMFQVDFFGLLSFTQLIARKMIRQKSGNIINISSVRGLKPEAGGIAYGTAKSAVAFATKILAQELGPFHIRVNAVAPGLIRTDMIRYKSGETVQDIIGKSALKKAGEKEDVVHAVLFLASEQAAFITGEIIKVDGGYEAAGGGKQSIKIRYRISPRYVAYVYEKRWLKT